MHTHAHTLLALSEGAGPEATASQPSAAGDGGGGAAAPAPAPAASSSADRGGPPAGKAIDKMLAANDSPRHHLKRKYPDPGFAVERTGKVGARGSYTLRQV